MKKGMLKNLAKFTGNHLCWSLFLNKTVDLKPATLFKKETPTQVFSCKYYEIFKNSFFYRTHPVAASASTVPLSISDKYLGPC